MDIHLFLLSTMSAEMTRQNLEGYGYTFDVRPSIQKFRWTPAVGTVTVCLWVCTMHPLCTALAASLIPYMDACILWYHDHDAMSCLRVEGGMRLLQRRGVPLSILASVTPRVEQSHASRVRRYFDEHGFEYRRVIGTLQEALHTSLDTYMSTAKTLD